MTNPSITDIVVVQDRSGSMATIQAAAQDGINEFINGQKSGPGTAFVTFVEFDDAIDTLVFRGDIGRWSNYTLVPRGMTALYDAIGRTINALGSRYNALPEDERPGKV